MESTTFLNALTLPPTSQTLEPTSLYAAFAQIEDGRKRRGRRYSLALVLTLIILGKLAGETTMSGIAHWARLRTDWLCSVFQLPRNCLPCANTYSLVSNRVHLDELNAMLARYFTASAVPAAEACGARLRGSHHLALDGKTLRGTRRHTQPAAVHLLGLYDITQRVMLAQHQVTAKDHEIRCAPQRIVGRHLQGCVLTADALHTQRAWCAQVLAHGGDYVLIAKANQPVLRQDIAFLFEGPWPAHLERRQAHTLNKGHGRLELRQLSASTERNELLRPQWPGIEQVFQIERTITKHGHTRHEVGYGITSLPARLAGPERLLALVRAHWQIENRVHWRRDVTLREDACQVRRGQAPPMLAVLNNVVLALMDRMKVTNVPAKMREFAANPAAALALLISPP